MLVFSANSVHRQMHGVIALAAPHSVCMCTKQYSLVLRHWSAKYTRQQTQRHPQHTGVHGQVCADSMQGAPAGQPVAIDDHKCMLGTLQVFTLPHAGSHCGKALLAMVAAAAQQRYCKTVLLQPHTFIPPINTCFHTHTRHN